VPRSLPTRRLFVALVALLTLPLGYTPDAAGKPPPAWPKTFVVEYFWGWDALPPDAGPTATLTLAQNGTFTAVDDWSGDTGTGTWFTRRGGREIVLRIDGIDLTYVGNRVAPGEYEGTMAVVGGLEGVWRGGFVP
jgi:hypothetical protein